ncbi:MAG: YciC family protein [Leucothrix sp.]
MNQVVIDSWNFFKNNAKELCAFMLPVFALSLIVGVISVTSPKSPILNVLSIVQLMIGPLFTGGLLFLIANISQGNHPAHKEMLAQAMPFWIPIFIVSMLTGLAIGAGFIFMIIPGIWFLVRLFLAPLYVVFQNKPIMEAISTAYADSKDHIVPFFQTLLPFIAGGMLLVFFVAKQAQEPPSLTAALLINLVTTFGFIFASVAQFRLYTIYIAGQSNA